MQRPLQYSELIVITCWKLSSEDGHTRVIKGLVSILIVKWGVVYKKAHLVLKGGSKCAKEIAYTLLHHCQQSESRIDPRVHVYITF